MRYLVFSLLLFPLAAFAQLSWQNVDSLYGPLPKGVHVFFTEQKIDTAPFRAYYLIADLKNKKLDFTTDTTFRRRLTPSQFYERNGQPLVVVNGTFFSFATNLNRNVVIRNGKALAHNDTYRGRGKDSVHQYYPFKSAIGISKKRKADVAWTYAGADSCCLPDFVNDFQWPILPENVNTVKSDGQLELSKRFDSILSRPKYINTPGNRKTKWKVQTAIGGGPVLVQRGAVVITNEEEHIFTGKAIHDKHPRTAMGYTPDQKLIILVIEGRNAEASGATLRQEAEILKSLGCVEALNLDGGGSSCLLINGKETIRPSDKQQRAVPAVFLIKTK